MGDLREMLGLHAPFVQILLRTTIVYGAIIVGMRITGRRQLGQMTPFDLVLILLISNAVQNAMVGPDNSVLGGLAAAAALFALNYLTGFASDRSSGFRRALEGDPILLVNDGLFIQSHLQIAQISEDMIMQAIREHGFDSLSQVHMAILEVDGTISIVPKDSKIVETQKSYHQRRHVRAVRPGGG